MAVGSHLISAADSLQALQLDAEHVTELLAEAMAAPMGDPTREAVRILLPVTKRLRHHAMELAACIGAAEAVR